MHPHLPALLRRRDLLPGNELEQSQEVEAIAKALVQFLDLDPNFSEVRVAPGGEGLYVKERGGGGDEGEVRMKASE